MDESFVRQTSSPAADPRLERGDEGGLTGSLAGPAIRPILTRNVFIHGSLVRDAIEPFTVIRRRSDDDQEQLTASWINENLPADDIETIRSLARDVFGDRVIASEWLQRPNLATDNRPPIALLGTQEGFHRVKTLLQRIEYGVLT